jgi:PucR C-terminal helix-turn-helix domain
VLEEAEKGRQAQAVSTELASRLRGRRAEIEEATFARVRAVSDPGLVEDPEYIRGLKAAVTEGIDHALDALEARRHAHHVPVPPQLLAQARLAARSGVSLDTVLRRYSAAYTLLGDYLIEEAESAGVSAEELKRALHAKAAVYDRLMAAISEEHMGEHRAGWRGAAQHRLELVRMLLAGDPADTDELNYELDAWHIGAVGCGEGAEELLRDLAARLDRRLLQVAVDEQTSWAWFGGDRRSETLSIPDPPRDAMVALGEPGRGIAGWRFTHRQAQAAIPVARRRGEGVVRYGEVCLLASMMQDEVVVQSLRTAYLLPLSRGGGHGRTLRQTLRTYFAVGRNASSTAAALDVHRKTVNNRLRSAEELFGRPLSACAAEVEAALRLEEMGVMAASPLGPRGR